jgi:exosome complex component RRP4
MQMRDLFKEGDVFACEIQKIMESGEVVVHCRSNKYGILRNGQLVQVDGSLVKRQSMHFVNLTTPDGDQIHIVLGNNGWIWIGLPLKQTGHIQSLNFTQMDSKDEIVDAKTRLKIAKIRNCIIALADAFMEVTVESITALLTELEKSGDIYVTDSVLKNMQDSVFGTFNRMDLDR